MKKKDRKKFREETTSGRQFKRLPLSEQIRKLKKLVAGTPDDMELADSLFDISINEAQEAEKFIDARNEIRGFLDEMQTMINDMEDRV